ncbi:GTPase Obg [Porphyridium purpureum]|uniref:GTPase Obg n=1 Tax=Porphyridium purpureum TaxID=35688 RepID=A0A5J4YNR8_PORPP|nr:GTPase Obg [Porphyridium purpureum]|eukprot:POR1286..scf295_9
MAGVTAGSKGYKFVDRVRLLVAAGTGGNGRTGFQSLPYQVQVAADGGNGGFGGNVYCVGTTSLQSLDLQGERVLRAESGGDGGGQRSSGRTGASVTVSVPLGTSITQLVPPQQYMESISQEIVRVGREKLAQQLAHGEDAEDEGEWFNPEDALIAGGPSDIAHHPALRGLGLDRVAKLFLKRKDIEYDRVLLAEVNEEGQRVLLAEGGRGGLGNAAFKSPQNRTPRATPGKPGQEKFLELELKSIADVGLVGLPNAGKSTFLRSISAATPKVAPYPFTTLHPILGNVKLSEADSLDLETTPNFTVADIPGIIEGSHENRGLGFGFLRHIERTSVLAFVVDVAPPEAGRTAVLDLHVLLRELELYQPGLVQSRRKVVLANKMDLVQTDSERNQRKLLANLRQLVDVSSRELGAEVIPICARHRHGVDQARLTLARMLGLLPEKVPL